jgi:hypothetical protein
MYRINIFDDTNRWIPSKFASSGAAAMGISILHGMIVIACQKKQLMDCAT